MPRPSQPDERKVKKILDFLREHPDSYISEIARGTKLSISTVWRYLTHYLKDKVEISNFIGSEKKKYKRLVVYYRIKGV